MTQAPKTLYVVAVPTAIMLGIFMIVGLMAHRQIDRTLTDWVLTELAHDAHAISFAMSQRDRDPSGDEWQEIANALGDAFNSRVTLIDEAGVVVGDSRVPKGRLTNLDNHNDRPEVAEARRNGFGQTSRYSDILGTGFHYVAVPFRQGGREYIARVAHAADDVAGQIAESHGDILAIAILGTLIAGILSLMAAQLLGRRMDEEKLRLKKALGNKTEDIGRLFNLGTMLSATNRYEEIGDIVQRLVPELLPGCYGGLAFIRASRDHVELKATWGETWGGKAAYRLSDCWALRTGRPYSQTESRNMPQCGHFNDTVKGFFMCRPLSARGETIGTLHIVKDSGKFNNIERRIISAISEDISHAYMSIQIRQKFRDQAIKDPLTDLFNRRFLTESLSREIGRAARKGGDLSVLMLDLDNFKQFNDQYGHDAGDAVLAELGTVIGQSARSHDVCCRYGGEEFAVVLPDTTTEEAAGIAERICENVRRMEVTHFNQLLAEFSVSVGVATYDATMEKAVDVLRAADQALYRAKQDGRDCYVVAKAA